MTKQQTAPMGAGLILLALVLLHLAFPQFLSPAPKVSHASNCNPGPLPVILGGFTVMLKIIPTAPEPTAAETQVSPFFSPHSHRSPYLFPFYFPPVSTRMDEGQ